MRPDDAYSEDYDRRERRGRWSDDDDEPRERRRRWADEDDDPPRVRRRLRRGSSYPVFPKVIFILDIIFCSIRLVMVPLSLFGAVFMQRNDPNNPMLPTTYFEVGTNLAVGLVGLLAAGLMLGRKRFGAILGVLAILAVLANMGVGFWQGTIQFAAQGFKPGSPEYVGGLVGLGLVALVRLVLLGLYVGALLAFLRMPVPRARARDEDADW
jgi:hypothetical protein